MNRVFRVVGSPGAAVQASLAAGQSIKVAYGSVSVSRAAVQIERGHYASLTGPADIVLSSPHPPSVFELTQKWTVNPRHLVAWHAKYEANVMEGPGEMVVSGRGGICRIDVGAGEELVIGADKLVAHTGPAGSITFRESRFDIARAWTAWGWNGIKNAGSWTARKARQVSRWFSSLVAKLGPPKSEPASAPTKPIEQPKPRLELPPKLEETLNQIRIFYGKVAARAYDYTHPPNLVFKGPCSVLIVSSQ